jgi:hypothetical protein
VKNCSRRAVKAPLQGCSYTWSGPWHLDGVLQVLLDFSGRLRHKAGGGSNLDAHRRSTEAGRQVRMLLSFQRPSRLAKEGDSSSSRLPGSPEAPSAGSGV